MLDSLPDTPTPGHSRSAPLRLRFFLHASVLKANSWLVPTCGDVQYQCSVEMRTHLIESDVLKDKILQIGPLKRPILHWIVSETWPGKLVAWISKTKLTICPICACLKSWIIGGKSLLHKTMYVHEIPDETQSLIPPDREIQIELGGTQWDVTKCGTFHYILVCLLVLIWQKPLQTAVVLIEHMAPEPKCPSSP